MKLSKKSFKKEQSKKKIAQKLILSSLSTNQYLFNMKEEEK